MSNILVVDDEEGVRAFVAESLALDGHRVLQAEDGAVAIRQLAQKEFDAVVTDLKMPNVGGIELVRHLQSEQPQVEILVLTAHGTIDNAVEAMKLGAFDFLQKPIGSPTELRLVVSRMLQHRALILDLDRAKRAAPPEVTLTWEDSTMREPVEAMRKVAATNATVLLLGESGTGKEVASRAIHQWSTRANNPFVAINCATLTDNLLESELFGHEKGAFTGAHQQRRGRIELAHGGTFFLDEVAELKPELQAKLLRVLQENQFERIGGTRSIEANVRWIAATNRDLRERMAQGLFREDLYHRLAVFPIHLPPLRERKSDIVPLSQALLTQICRELGKPNLRLSPNSLEKLQLASWPGNIRELRNTLERAAILASKDEIVPDNIQLDAALLPSAGTKKTGTLAELERTAIQQALQQCSNNRKQAAAILGIGVRTLYDKLKRYNLS